MSLNMTFKYCVLPRMPGGFSDRSPVVEWFWKIAENWDSKLQGKLFNLLPVQIESQPWEYPALPFKN